MAELSVIERSNLQRLETQIENGLQTFLQVGLALKDIRDLKLYREDHQTFEKYVSEKWGHSRQWAHQLINAVIIEQQIGENVSNCLQTPKTESQYRELAKLEPDKIPEVWEAVTKECEETGEQPTARKIKQFAAEIVEPEFEYVEVDESEIEPGDIDCGPVDWKPAHRKAVACCTALMRAIDDLNEVRPNDWHKKLSSLSDDIWMGLESWS